MANNYLQFSTEITHLTAGESAWIRHVLFSELHDQALELEAGADRPGQPHFDALPCAEFWQAIRECEEVGFEYELFEEDRTFWIHAGESGDTEQVARFMQVFLRKFRRKEALGFTYAETCSAPRVGEFGGGGVWISATETRWMNAHGWLENQKPKQKKARKPK